MDLGSIAQVARGQLPGALGSGKSGGSLEKLTIKYEKGGSRRFTGEIVALFNPNEFTIDYNVEWEAKKSATPGRGYRLHFNGASYSPATLSLNLFFDTYEGDRRAPGLLHSMKDSGTGTHLALFPQAKPSHISVTKYTEEMANLIRIDRELHRPPICKLIWGKLQIFRGVLTNLSQQFTLFQADGTPVRATLSCTFEQFRSTDPTFVARELDLHSADVPKTRTVRQGETLSMIAAQEYDDPTLWRQIATANNIHNPRVLTPGQVLCIPTLTL